MFLLITYSMKDTKRYIDLHSHTNYSDGLYVQPRENVALAALKGINIFAVTDHDNTAGYYEAKTEADKLGITLIPGVEITTPKYHLLGLNFDPGNKKFQDFLAYSKNIQNNKCKERINLIREYGFPITFDEVLKEFPNSRLAKYNIFAAMMKNPGCREIMEREFPEQSPLERFRTYFSKGGLVDGLEDVGVEVTDAVNETHNAGGVIIWAHPPKDAKDITEAEELFAKGIDGLEEQPKFVDKFNYALFRKFAEGNSLPISYGSDYHGPTFDRKILGMDENILSPELEELLNQGYVKIPSIKLEEVLKCP
ncbi:PHP domain protein [uncultured archaeon]|nr:PHP domain protein [uncultured archaeon]